MLFCLIKCNICKYYVETFVQSIRMPCRIIYDSYDLNCLKWRLCHLIKASIWKTPYSEMKKENLVASQLDLHKRTRDLIQKSYDQTWNYRGLCKNRNLYPLKAFIFELIKTFHHQCQYFKQECQPFIVQSHCYRRRKWFAMLKGNGNESDKHKCENSANIRIRSPFREVLALCRLEY